MSARADARLESLLAPFVLDAVSTVERIEVERYLEGHPRAAAEAARLRHAVEAVVEADAVDHPPPGDLWRRILRDLPERDGGRRTAGGRLDRAARAVRRVRCRRVARTHVPARFRRRSGSE